MNTTLQSLLLLFLAASVTADEIDFSNAAIRIDAAIKAEFDEPATTKRVGNWEIHESGAVIGSKQSGDRVVAPSFRPMLDLAQRAQVERFAKQARPQAMPQDTRKAYEILTLAKSVEYAGYATLASNRKQLFCYLVVHMDTNPKHTVTLAFRSDGDKGLVDWSENDMPEAVRSALKPGADMLAVRIDPRNILGAVNDGGDVGGGAGNAAGTDAGDRANLRLDALGLGMGASAIAEAKDFDRWWEAVKPTLHSPPISRDLTKLPAKNSSAADALTLLIAASRDDRWPVLDKLRDGEEVEAEWLQGSNLLGMSYAYFFKRLPSVKIFLSADLTVDETKYQMLVFRLEGKIKADDGKLYPYMIGNTFVFKERAADDWVLTDDLDETAFVMIPQQANMAYTQGMVSPKTYGRTLRRTPKECTEFWKSFLPAIEKGGPLR